MRYGWTSARRPRAAIKSISREDTGGFVAPVLTGANEAIAASARRAAAPPENDGERRRIGGLKENDISHGSRQTTRRSLMRTTVPIFAPNRDVRLAEPPALTGAPDENDYRPSEAFAEECASERKDGDAKGCPDQNCQRDRPRLRASASRRTLRSGSRDRRVKAARIDARVPSGRQDRFVMV
jgi:hypothetical protein